MDRRHLRRQKIVQELFASMFTDDVPESDAHDKTRAIIAVREELDEHVTQYAQKYEADNIAKVDLAILRLAIYELLHEKKVPPKVIINEAVELAKELGGDKSPGFVNAVLGKIYEEQPHPEESEVTEENHDTES